MLGHAKMLRSLIDIIPGRPCIIVNGHPIKNANADNLLPAGGGSFLNEMDGNLTALKTESTVEMHWQGKYRGPDFPPMFFLIAAAEQRLQHMLALGFPRGSERSGTGDTRSPYALPGLSLRGVARSFPRGASATGTTCWFLTNCRFRGNGRFQQAIVLL
jgi:hypothetical protein